MKRTVIITLALIIFSTIIGVAKNTNLEYANLISANWKLCLEKDFAGSAKLYEKAFKLNNKVPLNDRYNASCIYALSENKDMAFHHLFITANDLKWDDYNHLINDSDLKVLHSDKRWEELISIVLQNKEQIEAHFDKDLVAVLDKIYFDDQRERTEKETNKILIIYICTSLHRSKSKNILL